MDPFPYYFPTPPGIDQIDGYIEKLRCRINHLKALERRYGKELIFLQAEQFRLRLAENHRDIIRDNYRIKLPVTAEELRELSRCIQDELEAIKAHIRKEEEKAIPFPVGDPRSQEAISFDIPFDKEIVEDLQAYLGQIKECLASIAA